MNQELLQVALQDSAEILRHVGSNTNVLQARMFKAVNEAVRASYGVGFIPDPFARPRETADSFRPYPKYKPGCGKKGEYVISKVGPVTEQIQRLSGFFENLLGTVEDSDTKLVQLSIDYLAAMQAVDATACYAAMNRAYSNFSRKIDHEPRTSGVMTKVGALSAVHIIVTKLEELAQAGFYPAEALEETIGLLFNENLSKGDYDAYLVTRSERAPRKKASEDSAAQAAAVAAVEDEEIHDSELLDGDPDNPEPSEEVEDDEEGGEDEVEDDEEDDEPEPEPVQVATTKGRRK